MKTTLNTHEIADALKRDTNANWSYQGSKALAEYLEEQEESSGTEMELDVVAIRCDFSEYSSLQDWAVEYFGGKEEVKTEFDMEVDPDNDDLDEKIKEYIRDHGQLIEFTGGIIVSSF